MMDDGSCTMDCRFVSFGVVEIGGRRYERDVVIEDGSVKRRKKGPSKPRRAEFGHTPLTAGERIPWSAGRLVIGTGANGQLPIADDVYREAAHRGVEIVARPTPEACRLLSESAGPLSAILHVTC
jgi:hypothetical protein